ncbi:MAG: HlyC/CorC family transporter [Lachnospiraceae bacterium]|nr:HlyC/CorC family transporter [Lachnospiraceae bacterium]
MSPAVIFQLVILILLIVLSAFFSSAETAFSSTNRIKMRTLAEEENKTAALVLKILDSYSKLLSAILIGNNVVNLSASSLATTIAIALSEPLGIQASLMTGLATGILTVVVLLSGEIVPKTWANLYADKIVLVYAPIISFLMAILTPVIFIVDKISTAILKLFRIDPNKKNSTMTENELRSYVDVSHEDGVIEEEEREMIYNVFDFGDSLAKDIMIPRIDMVSVEDTATYKEIMELFRENMYTRLPVYHDSTDNIIGIINVKDFLFVKDTEKFAIKDILRDAYYTYEYKKTSDLMMEMRKSSSNIALVLNEYGSTEGMITLEDLLEEIVGEIRDEYDEDEETLIQDLGDNTYVVPGGMKLDDINNSIDTRFSSEDYDSIGGLIIEKLDKLPEEGETVELEDGTKLTVKTVNQNRIEEVTMVLPTPQTENEEATESVENAEN